jgi:hypothetical protein
MPTALSFSGRIEAGMASNLFEGEPDEDAPRSDPLVGLVAACRRREPRAQNELVAPIQAKCEHGHCAEPDVTWPPIQKLMQVEPPRVRRAQGWLPYGPSARGSPFTG